MSPRLLPDNRPDPHMFANPRKDNSVPPPPSSPIKGFAQPLPMWLPAWAQHLRCSPHPLQQCKNPAKATSQGLVPVLGHKSRVRQRRQLHSGPHPMGRRDSPLPRLLGFILFGRMELHSGFPRGPRNPILSKCRCPPRLPDLPPPLSSLRGPPPLQDHSRSDDLVCGRVRPHRRLPVVSGQYPPPPGTLQEFRKTGPPPRRLLQVFGC